MRQEGARSVSRVKNENFITTFGWMLNELGLKGNELRVYAIIYGFSQVENQAFTGSLRYLADWISGTKPTVIKCLKSLVEKGYITKSTKIINGVKSCEYRCVDLEEIRQRTTTCGMKDFLPTTDGMKETLPGGKETLPGVVKNFDRGGKEILPGGGKETLPNNIVLNIDKETIGEKIVYMDSVGFAPTTPETQPQKSTPKKRKSTSSKFVPPSLDEIAAYCRERGNNVDAQRFYDYYAAVNWRRGNTRITDWQAQIRIWEGDNQNQQARPSGGFQQPKAEVDHAAGGHESGWGWA